jgi:hypothetical protein
MTDVTKLPWQPISTAKPGEKLILYFPPALRSSSDEIVLAEMIRCEIYPVDYARQPTHWMPSTAPDDAVPSVYGVWKRP